MTDPPESNAPRRAGRGAEENDNKCNSQTEVEKIIQGLPPSQATLSQRAVAPLTIEDQVWGSEPSREAIVNRLQTLYQASRYLARCRPGGKGKSAYTETLQAVIVLAQRFALLPREIFQLLRLEFNPRCQKPLSDDRLWRLTLAMTRPGTASKGWLNDSTKPSKKLRPLAPKWMREKPPLLFWYPSSMRHQYWIESVSHKAPNFPREFLDGISSLRDQRQRANELGGPPLADHPLTMSEIGEHLGIPNQAVVNHLQELDHHSLIVYISLDFVPGIYSGVLVPNPQV